jgi:TrmH family RNA methyltransferase
VITSRQNPKIQWVKTLQSRSRLRWEEQLFVVEGVRLAEEALASACELRLLLYTEELDARGQGMVAAAIEKGCPVEVVTSEVMRAASDTRSPQGLLLVVSIPNTPAPQALTFVLIADGIRDPGNLGTLLRTASAAGIETVFLPPGAVDLYSPKVVRSAMGAHFHLPVYLATWAEIESRLREYRMRVYLADARNGQVYSQVDWRPPLALIIGSEAEGASQSARIIPHTRVSIPMASTSESLNAAIAAAILLFEAVRQRGIVLS